MIRGGAGTGRSMRVASMRVVSSTMIASSILLACATASADAVPARPKGCPRGSVGATGHSGSYCDPKVCQTDVDCTQIWNGDGFADGKCETTSLCVERQTVRVRRRGDYELNPSGPATYEKVIARASCRPGGRCENNERCETAMRCVAPSSPPAVVREPPGGGGAGRGCGCGKATKTNASALVPFLLGLWALRKILRPACA